MLSVRAGDDLGRSYTVKTPRRGLQQQLPRTLMKENATRGLGSQTVKSGRVGYPATPGMKGFESIGPQRLFGEKLLGTTSNMKASTSQQPASRLAALADKTNKTPFILRTQFPVTPLPAQKLQLGATPKDTDTLDLPSPVLRPSSTRKSIRAPRSASKNFQTPERRGRRPHWDISDGDISVEIVNLSAGGLGLDNEIIEEGAELDEDDDDEIEYMPPSGTEIPYDPGFDMPDYRALGAAIMSFSRYPTYGNDLHIDWDAPCEPVEVPPLSPSRARRPDEFCPFPKRTAPLPATNKPVQPAKILRSTGKQIAPCAPRAMPVTATTIRRPATKTTVDQSALATRRTVALGNTTLTTKRMVAAKAPLHTTRSAVGSSSKPAAVAANPASKMLNLTRGISLGSDDLSVPQLLGGFEELDLKL
ncbi:hypothetical protein FRB99_005698 [Tulasnella sp. 403]|nr:hypothetical protein FRB99_005698 [Tulasnella sp. 403]